jgi:hypothetical protein
MHICFTIITYIVDNENEKNVFEFLSLQNFAQNCGPISISYQFELLYIIGKAKKSFYARYHY